MTMTAMVQSHQSRCSSFCSLACISGRPLSAVEEGLSVMDVDGNELIIVANNGNGRKCGRSTARAIVPRDSFLLDYYNANTVARAAPWMDFAAGIHSLRKNGLRLLSYRAKRGISFSFQTVQSNRSEGR